MKEKRRAELANVRNKRRKKRGVFRAVVYLMAAAAIAVGTGSFFKISNIQVTGNVIYSEEEITASSGIKKGSNLFLLNGRDVESSILEDRNFVDSVKVRRKFPSTVELDVQESTLLAYIMQGDTYYIINRKCEILSTGDAASAAGYIQIIGAQPLAPRVGEQLSLGEADAPKLQYLEDVMEQLMKADIYGKVQWIDVSNIASVKFIYRGSLVVELGRNEELDKKFKMLGSILADLSENERGTINLATVGEGHYIPES